jgi:cytochrome c553
MSVQRGTSHAIVLTLCATIAALWGGAAAAAATPEERMAPCLACHGANGQSETPLVPSLGAQPSAYVVIQLYMFREKLRVVEPMNEMTRELGNDDLQRMADLVAGLPAATPAAAPEGARMERARALVQRHHCDFCHGGDFAGHDNIPRIASQREDYLAKSLRDYRSNARPGYDASMADVVQPLNDGDIEDLAYFMAHSP